MSGRQLRGQAGALAALSNNSYVSNYTASQLHLHHLSFAPPLPINIEVYSILEDEEQIEGYRQANKEVRRLLRKAKEEWAEEQARLVERNFEMNNTRKVLKAT